MFGFKDLEEKFAFRLYGAPLESPANLVKVRSYLPAAGDILGFWGVRKHIASRVAEASQHHKRTR